MKIFFYCMKPEPYIVSFLCERGHELSFRSENSKSLTENFESTLASIHVSDVAIFDVTQSASAVRPTCAAKQGWPAPTASSSVPRSLTK